MSAPTPQLADDPVDVISSVHKSQASKKSIKESERVLKNKYEHLSNRESVEERKSREHRMSEANIEGLVRKATELHKTLSSQGSATSFHKNVQKMNDSGSLGSIEVASPTVRKELSPAKNTNKVEVKDQAKEPSEDSIKDEISEEEDVTEHTQSRASPGPSRLKKETSVPKLQKERSESPQKAK